MHTYPECYECMVRTAHTAMQSSHIDPDIQIKALRKVLAFLSEASVDVSPSHITNHTNRIMREVTGVDDFYTVMKAESTRLALEIYPQLKNMAAEGADKLEQLLKISAAGNIIDVVHTDDYDLMEEVHKTVNQLLMGDSLEIFRRRLESAGNILYLADNTGETVFDRVFIEELGRPLTYIVKGGAILNDAAMQEAIDAGIDRIAPIVETGSRGPGTILEDSTPEFQQLFAEADLVIAKGQANLETLDDQGEKVFHLFRVKCPLLGELVGFPVGNLVLKQATPL